MWRRLSEKEDGTDSCQPVHSTDTNRLSDDVDGKSNPDAWDGESQDEVQSEPIDEPLRLEPGRTGGRGDERWRDEWEKGDLERWRCVEGLQGGRQARDEGGKEWKGQKVLRRDSISAREGRSESWGDQIPTE